MNNFDTKTKTNGFSAILKENSNEKSKERRWLLTKHLNEKNRLRQPTCKKKKRFEKKRRNSIEKKKQNKHSSGCDTRTHTATTESFSGAVVKGECFMANNHFKSNIIINWRSNWIRKNRLKMGIERRNDHAILHGNRLQHIAKIT